MPLPPVKRKKTAGKNIAAGILLLATGGIGICLGIYGTLLAAYAYYENMLALIFLLATLFCVLPVVAGARCLIGKGKILALIASIPLLALGVLYVFGAITTSVSYPFATLICAGSLVVVLLLTCVLRLLPDRQKAAPPAGTDAPPPPPPANGTPYTPPQAPTGGVQPPTP